MNKIGKSIPLRAELLMDFFAVRFLTTINEKFSSMESKVKIEVPVNVLKSKHELLDRFYSHLSWRASSLIRSVEALEWLLMCLPNHEKRTFFYRHTKNRVLLGNAPIAIESEAENFTMVRALLLDARVDPSAHDNAAIYWACWSGEKQLVNVLLHDKRVNPSAGKSRALVAASTWGHHRIVRLLLRDRRADPSARNYAPVMDASEYGHTLVLKLLLGDSRVKLSSEQIRKVIKLAPQRERSEVAILIDYYRVRRWKGLCTGWSAIRRMRSQPWHAAFFSR